MDQPKSSDIRPDDNQRPALGCLLGVLGIAYSIAVSATFSLSQSLMKDSHWIVVWIVILGWLGLFIFIRFKVKDKFTNFGLATLAMITLPLALGYTGQFFTFVHNLQHPEEDHHYEQSHQYAGTQANTDTATPPTTTDTSFDFRQASQGGGSIEAGLIEADMRQQLGESFKSAEVTKNAEDGKFIVFITINASPEPRDTKMDMIGAMKKAFTTGSNISRVKMVAWVGGTRTDAYGNKSRGGEFVYRATLEGVDGYKVNWSLSDDELLAIVPLLWQEVMDHY